MNWLPHLVTLVVGLGLGTIYGSRITDIWWEDRNNAN